MISAVYGDDDLYVTRIVSLLCERCGGVTVHPLFSAKAAVSWITRHPVDVIVSDYTLPGMNGIELFKTLRTRGIKAPFIIFSGVGIDEIMQESTIFGIDVFGYCSKNDNIRRQIPNLVEMIAKAAACSFENSECHQCIRDNE